MMQITDADEQRIREAREQLAGYALHRDDCAGIARSYELLGEVLSNISETRPECPPELLPASGEKLRPIQDGGRWGVSLRHWKRSECK